MRRLRLLQGRPGDLCDRARYTGYQIDGGYAESAIADHRYTFPLPDAYTDAEAAPLLCAGLIGYRAYRLALESTPGVRSLGLYGFGAAAHIICQVAVHHGRTVYAFTRPGDDRGQAFALEVGAGWSGPADVRPPAELDAAIIFAPAGELVPAALRTVARGGTVVCAGFT